MTSAQAETILSDFFAPASIDDFFDALAQNSFDLHGGPDHPRRHLFGDDPKQTLLASYASHATNLKSYGLAPTLPPPATRAVDSPDEFRDLIKSFHEREYTVRVPDVIPLSPRLQEVTRALETLLRKPVQSALFWSKAEAKAIIHYDNRDNIAVQLHGKKRWFISTDPPGLQNNWKQVGEPVPELPRYRVVDAEPGDLIYIPRGTPHTVESTSESLHLAILFIPTTLREAIVAAFDYLSDFDAELRQPAFGRAAEANIPKLTERVTKGLARLTQHCSTDGFLEGALDLRSSRMVSELPPLPKPGAVPQLTLATLVRHAPLAIAHLRAAQGTLDFTIPGEHIAIHRGVEQELRFIAEAEQFRIGDIPGQSSDDVRVALVSRLIASGLLQVTE
jgi:hypothetical protein